jgi:hypothetical protein
LGSAFGSKSWSQTQPQDGSGNLPATGKRSDMHWVLQGNLLNQQTLAELQKQLSTRQIPFTTVKLIPFLNALSPDVEIEAKAVFTYGSTGLGHVSKSKKWQPGYFDDNLDYRLYQKNFDTEMLNCEAVSAPMGELKKHWDRFFLRPVSDSKQFAGEVMTWEQFEIFRNGVRLVENDDGVTLTLKDVVVMAPCKEILAEYRFFVIDGEVVTGSQYKIGDQVKSSSDVPRDIYGYAVEQVARWQPNRAFAIDIAQTDQGLKIIELNSANSAGFYACDIGKIVDAVERLGLSVR